ncbi:MAG: thiopurine S-methyltransferase [Gammaproteobacteria bacterium]|nr:thiopurine S-methyltransferase [Gammaproteobacteria bacterium]
MAEDWLDRWSNGRTGWHEAGGNAGLRAHWQFDAKRVLVPLCGKTPDLAWLARRGHEVTGVELSDIAARDFFVEQGLGVTRGKDRQLDAWYCEELPLTIVVGDYFEFEGGPFDALYDRGALVAVDPDRRAAYARHTRSLLTDDARLLVITLEYDQQVVTGPPFSVMPTALRECYGNLERVGDKDDLENCPPKFRDAGLTRISEVVWRSSG